MRAVVGGLRLFGANILETEASNFLLKAPPVALQNDPQGFAEFLAEDAARLAHGVQRILRADIEGRLSAAERHDARFKNIGHRPDFTVAANGKLLPDLLIELVLVQDRSPSLGANGTAASTCARDTNASAQSPPLHRRTERRRRAARRRQGLTVSRLSPRVTDAHPPLQPL